MKKRCIGLIIVFISFYLYGTGKQDVLSKYIFCNNLAEGFSIYIEGNTINYDFEKSDNLDLFVNEQNCVFFVRDNKLFVYTKHSIPKQIYEGSNNIKLIKTDDNKNLYFIDGNTLIEFGIDQYELINKTDIGWLIKMCNFIKFKYLEVSYDSDRDLWFVLDKPKNEIYLIEENKLTRFASGKTIQMKKIHNTMSFFYNDEYQVYGGVFPYINNMNVLIQDNRLYTFKILDERIFLTKQKKNFKNASIPEYFIIQNNRHYKLVTNFYIKDIALF